MQKAINPQNPIYPPFLKLFLLVGILSIYACKPTEKTVSDYSEQAIELTGVPQIQQPIEEEFLEDAQPAWVVEEGEYNASETIYFDLTHTKLELSFNWEKQHVLGKASISVSPHFYSQEKLVLDAKGFDIHNIELLNGETATPF